MFDLRALYLQNDYEWSGSFWFPKDSQDAKYAGKLTYSPEKGLSIELSTRLPLSTFRGKVEPLCKKIMHGFIRNNEDAYSITLVDVYLNRYPWRSQDGDMTLQGVANVLVVGAFLVQDELDGLWLEYDQQYENIFINSACRERHAIALGKADALSFSDQLHISFKTESSGKILSTLQDVEDFFWFNSDADLASAKQALTPLLTEHKIQMFLRDKLSFFTALQKNKEPFRFYYEKEQTWRLFWQLLSDCPISAQRAWVQIDQIENGKEKSFELPLLCSFLNQKIEKLSDRHLFHLPLNFYHVSGEKQDFSLAQAPLKKWFSICADPDWAPIIAGIKRSMKFKTSNKLPQTSDYVALLSEIQMFMDLAGQIPKNLDQLINVYASEKWRADFSDLIQAGSPNKTLGQFATKVRDAIVHPIGLKNQDNGKWRSLAFDELHLARIYAFVSGLLIKGVLSFVGGINNEGIEKYTQAYVSERTSFGSINYVE